MAICLAFTTVSVFGQQEPPDGKSAKGAEHTQFELKWKQFSAKLDTMDTSKKDKAAIEAEYNELIDDMDALYHPTPAPTQMAKKEQPSGLSVKTKKQGGGNAVRLIP